MLPPSLLTASLGSLAAGEQAAVAAQAATIIDLAAVSDSSRQTEIGFSLYSRKLQLLATLGILRPPILYPATGVDFFPAFAGEMTTIDSDPEMVPGAYLPLLRRQTADWNPPPPLPPDDTDLHIVRADLDTRDWERRLERRFRTIIIKGLANIIAPPGTNSYPVPALAGLTDKLLPEGALLLFDKDHEVLGGFVEGLGFSEVRFPSPLQEAFQTSRPDVFLFVGLNWENAVGVRPGNLPHIYRRPG